MKTLLFILTFWVTFNLNAQDYLISFTGSKTPVNYVTVENLTTGETLNLNGSDVLNLKGNMGITGIIDNSLSSGIKIYPNPMTNNSTIEFYPPVSGNATISIYDLSGKQVSRLQIYLENSKQEFKITGEGKGLYIINIRGISYQLSGKLICNGNSAGNLSIEKVNINQIVEEKNFKNVSKGTGVIIEMLYLPGNKLKFTATSGEYRTILTDIPDQNKTITFDLIPVVDADKNNYHLVKMGSQIWLEENLKTTKYNDNSNITQGWKLDSTNNGWYYTTTPGYVWYNNDIINKNPCGALYNWFVVNTGSLCPAGYHVPSTAEWQSMKDYLAVNSQTYTDGSDDIAKSIASKTGGWEVFQPYTLRGEYHPVYDGSIGKNQATNNSTGFNGFPSGIRDWTGSFYSIGKEGAWWSATGNDFGADGVSIDNHRSSDFFIGGSDYPRVGLSVRCLKD